MYNLTYENWSDNLDDSYKGKQLCPYKIFYASYNKNLSIDIPIKYVFFVIEYN